MQIEIISVGKPKSTWLQEGIDHYRQLASRYAQIDLTRVKESSGSRGGETVRTEESARLQARLDDKALTILLDERGKQHDSFALANLIERSKLKYSKIQFLIGGAFGVDETVRGQVKQNLSLSKLTLPHDLVQLFLLEQVFRGLSILAGSKYHK